MEFFATFLEQILSAEDSSVSLHNLLHLKSNFSSRLSSLGESDSVQVGNSFFTSVFREVLLRLAWFHGLNCSVGGSSSKNNEIEKRVSSKSVSTVYRSASNLTSSEKTWDNLVLAISTCGDNLSFPVSGNTTHIVMDSRYDWNRFLCNINTSENMSCFRDTW